MPGYSNERKPSPAYKFLTDLFTALVIVVFLALIALLFASPFMRAEPEPEPTLEEPLEAAAEGISCDTLITAAMQVSDEGCQQTGSNEVCYGNNTINAQLVPDFSGLFQTRGDIVPIDALETLAASPLDLDSEEWGIAVLKMQATLPETVPGQNVTFLIFGDTQIDNASGDMQAFYLSTGLGSVGCEEVPFDGMMVTTPDGMAINFLANDVDITLSGLATMTLKPGEGLAISLLRGIGLVTSNGVSQPFGAGYSVSIPMDGTSASGPPSIPEALADAVLSASCALTGVGCPGDDLETTSEEEAAAALDALGVDIPDDGGSTTGGATTSGSTTTTTTDGGTADGSTTDGGATGTTTNTTGNQGKGKGNSSH